MINIASFDKVEFENNMNNGKDKLHLLKLVYLAAQLREHELKTQFDAVYNKILLDNEFYVSKDYSRCGINIGDRITNNDNDFSMSEDDFNRYQSLCTIEMYKRGLTTEDGTYCKGCNGMEIKLQAENNLVDYQISLLPIALQEEFKAVKRDYILKHKFIDIIMKGKE
jgi:hypothetical protein